MSASRITPEEAADLRDAVRAVLELAIVEGGPLKREQIAQAQEIPTAFLQNINVGEGVGPGVR